MERDRLIPGNILFSDYRTLRTTDWIEATVVHVFIGYDFASITGFVQTSAYEIIVVDNTNNCLRVFNRLYGKLYKFAGDCRQEGIRDGINPSFTRPYSIMQDNQNHSLFYLIDDYNSAVRMVIKSVVPRLATLIKRRDRLYTDLTQDPDGKFLYFTHSKGLELFNLLTNTSNDIIAESTNFADNAMIYDSDIGSFVAIIILQNNFIMLADSTRNVLFLVDLNTNSTSTICTGVEGYRSGNASFCQTNRPMTLLNMDGDIYVGEYLAISVFKGRIISKMGLDHGPHRITFSQNCINWIDASNYTINIS